MNKCTGEAVGSAPISRADEILSTKSLNHSDFLVLTWYNFSMDENLSPITPPAFQESPKKNKRFIFVMLMILVVVLIAGYFGFMKWRDADWKTYKNEEYGFEFKYPQSFLLSTSSPEYIAFNINNLGEFRVLVEYNPKHLPLESWLYESVGYYTQSKIDELGIELASGVSYDEKNINISDMKGIRGIMYGGEDNLRFLYSFVPKSERVFAFVLFYDGNNKMLEDSYDKIISTFKLIPVSKSLESQKTTHYSNDFYEFDYPDIYKIEKEKIFDIHEKTTSMKDLFGVSFVDFIGSMGQKANLSSSNWLNATQRFDPDKSVALQKDLFEKELRENPADTFEEISIGDLRGYRILRPYYETEESSRIGSLEVGLFSRSYSYTLGMHWVPTEFPISADKFQRDAEYFVDIFVKTFKEKNIP